MNGHGVYKYIDGTTIEGEFCDGKMTGVLNITLPNGENYSKELVNGLCMEGIENTNGSFNGTGKLFKENGEGYIGEFSEGTFVNGKMLKETLYSEIKDS